MGPRLCLPHNFCNTPPGVTNRRSAAHRIRISTAIEFQLGARSTRLKASNMYCPAPCTRSAAEVARCSQPLLLTGPMHTRHLASKAVRVLAPPSLCKLSVTPRKHTSLYTSGRLSVASPCQPLQQPCAVLRAAPEDDPNNPIAGGQHEQPASSSSPAGKADEGQGPSGSGNSPSGSPQPRQPASSSPWRPLAWVQRLLGEPRAQMPLRLLFNMAVLGFLMRLWPIGGRPAEASDPLVLNLPFSDVSRPITMRVCPPFRHSMAGVVTRVSYIQHMADTGG